MLFVCSEVQKAVNAAQSLHHRWSELLLEGAGASKEEMDWTTNELRNSLRSIEWDLEDLDETINILKTGTVCFWCLCRIKCHLFLNWQRTHCRIQPKEIQPGCSWAVQEKSLHHQHQTDSKGMSSLARVCVRVCMCLSTDGSDVIGLKTSSF